jgi:hypothetical protein
MRQKVEGLATSLTKAIAEWDSVECVSLGEHSEADPLDPYFALVLDVYHRGKVPAPDARRGAFAAALGQPGAFESSTAQPKDRFFIGGLPVRVEYKSAESIEEIIGRGLDLVWALKNSGTYMFYRLQGARILYRKSPWIDEVRSRLERLPDDFWAGLREAFEAKMEHYLSDLGAAAMRDDGFFYLVSAAGFIRYAAAALFMANRRFEPSHRAFEVKLRELPLLPESFFGRWETLLSPDDDFSRPQKYEVAQQLAKSILAIE